ncbi:enoyl-CoA hydratase/isomerase family protein [Chloroflexota bacterium]
MNFSHIIFDKSEGIATIALNRPDKLNAIGARMCQEMSEAFDIIRNDGDIRIMALTGVGKGFCSGQDLGATAQRLAKGVPRTSGATQLLRAAGWFGVEISQIDKPTIAAVNGVAAGGGLSMALACDIRIASERAKFGAVFVRRGLVLESASSYFAPRVLGLPKALELYFTGDVIDATEAERIGIVNRVVPHKDLRAVSRELAIKIARNAPISVGLTKRALYRGAEATDPTIALEFEAAALSWCFATEDVKEGVQAFLGKREPVFKGR